jgi:predicted AlkP superfamily phosphohydrolase/phosphomutase
MKVVSRLSGKWTADTLLYVETFFLVGLFFGFEALYVTDYQRFPMDYFLLLTAIALTHAILGVAIGLPIALLGALAHAIGGDSTKRATNFFHVLACITFLLLPQFILFWMEWSRPISLKDQRFQTGLFLEVAVVLVLAVFLALRMRSPENIRRFRRLLGSIAVALSIFLLGIVPSYTLLETSLKGSASTGSKSEAPATRVETGRKVIVIGMDGASWSVIDRLREEGKLPNISRLITSGASGSLESIVSELTPFADISSAGMRSNVIWTSIATGKSPRKHGVHDFLFTRIAGLSHPFPARLPFFEVFKRLFPRLGARCITYEYPTSASRRCKALWNILSAQGKHVAVDGWWLTLPAEAVKGWMIADRPYNLNAVYPETEQLVRALDDYRKGMDDRASRVAVFTTFPFDPNYADHLAPSSRDYSLQSALDQLARDFVFDEIKARLAVTEIESGSSDLVMLYFLGPDNAEHFFWKFYDPEPFGDVSPEEISYFGGIIGHYYAWIDSMVGVISDRIDDDTVMLLCSDHGMGPWTDDRKGIIPNLLAPSHLVNSGNHRKEGVLILHGNGIRKGVRLKGSGVLDIAPTVLALLGLPVARDFEGRVLEEAFTPEFSEKLPTRFVDTFEDGQEIIRKGSGNGTKDDMERLRALGYIN